MIKKFVLSIAAGVIWGWVAMAVNSVTWAFPFEGSFLHNLVSFAMAGAIFGVVAGGLLSALEGRLPFKNHILKAVIVSTAIWLVLRVGAAVLSKMEPSRFNNITSQNVQGFFLAIFLGIMLGLLLKDGPASFQRP